MDPGSTEVQLALINQKLDLLIEQRTDHEARLRSLEKDRWKIAGGSGSLGAIAGYLAQFIQP